MKCKKCGAVMFVNNNIVFTSNPPQYQLCCPECGHVEYEYYDEITLQDLGNHITCQDCEQKDQQIAELKKQLALTEKALELACLAISKAMCPNGDWEVLKKDFADAYKQQAEKEISDGI